MPDSSGLLNQVDAKLIDVFLIRHNPDGRLSCPVTGARVPISSWKVTNRLCLAPLMGVGLGASKNHVAMLQVVSPAGGVVLLDAVAIGLVGVATVN